MAEIGDPPTVDQDEGPVTGHLTPLRFPDGWTPGKYAPWDCSPEPIYGPDELGEYKSAVEELVQNSTRADAAARIWEVLQAWEQRLFERNYHFLNAGWKGWGMFGGSAGTTGASILQTQNTMKLFSCNVFGARHNKIVSALSREVPGVTVVARDDRDPMDQTAAEEAEKYLKIFLNDPSLHRAVVQASSFLYTDDRVAFFTRTVADQARWGTEMVDADQEVFGPEESSGVTPETENEPDRPSKEQPARREVTEAYGKLECKVPLQADEEHDMAWVRIQKEHSINMLKEMFPWIEDEIATQGNVGGMDQIDRMARINVRLAVQASSSSGEAWKSDATLTRTWFRPSEYRALKKEVRDVFYQTFPDGLVAYHAGGTLAFVRNESFSKKVKIIHPQPGSGQNRRSIGTNYLPLQKVLNANISLLDRYFRSAVPRRYALEPYIDTQQLNSQSNDPAKVTAITGLEGRNLTIDQITGIEKVPQPNSALVEFVQWLIQGAPEAMDGATPAMFGQETSDTFGQARLNRDQALQVYSMPWRALCEGIAAAAGHAIESAAANRQSNFSASLPGQQRMEIEIANLQGNVLAYPESVEIPRTLAEQEEQMASLLESAKNVDLYQAIVSDPRNLSVFSKFPSLADLNVPGADAVEQQEGEFEILLRSGPVDNPMIAQINEQIAAAEGSPESQTPEGQQMLAQLQQALQSLPPQVSTVPVAQDNSENHAIHGAVALGMLTSPTGRKLKFGDDEQKAIFQNLYLHWKEHEAVLEKLKPPPEVEMKATVTVDPTKLPPEAQAKAFQALGLEVTPQDVTPVEQEHEVTQESEGIDPATGVPTKRKISVVGKPLR